MGNCYNQEIDTLRDDISLLRMEQLNEIKILRNEIYIMNAFFKPYTCEPIVEPIEPSGPPPYLKE